MVHYLKTCVFIEKSTSNLRWRCRGNRPPVLQQAFEKQSQDGWRDTEWRDVPMHYEEDKPKESNGDAN